MNYMFLFVAALAIDVVNVNPIIPTSILGLIGTIFFYLYGSYKNKKDNELKEIQSIRSDKAKAEIIESRLNEFGTRIPTSGLSPEQKFQLLKSIIKAKTIRYLIAAIISIAFGIVILAALLITNHNKDKLNISELHLSGFVIGENGRQHSIDLGSIAKLETFTNIEGDWLNLKIHFPAEEFETIRFFQFSFGKEFSKRLGADRANPENWTVTSHDGEFIYEPAELQKDLEFQVSYKQMQ